MLGKLIKHEWKDVYKVGCILSLVIIAVTAIGCIMLQLPAMTSLFAENSNLSEGQIFGWVIMGVMSFLLYLFILLGATYGLFIFLGIRFYRTMYTDQGYLTNTLPVTSHQLLISKILVAGIWYLILEIVVAASIFALVIALMNGLLSDTLASEGYRSIWEALGALLPEMGKLYSEMGLNMIHYGISMGLTLLISPFAGIAVLFGSVTLGQLSRKHKAVMGILAYFGVMLVNMIINSIAQTVSTFRYSYDVMYNEYGSTVFNINGSLDFSFILTIIMAVILYVTSHYILTRKLNLD